MLIIVPYAEGLALLLPVRCPLQRAYQSFTKLCVPETLCRGSCDIANSTAAGHAACQKACNCCVPYAEGLALLLPVPCPMQRAYQSFYQTCVTETLCGGSCDIASSTAAGHAAAKRPVTAVNPTSRVLLSFLLPIQCPMQRAYQSFTKLCVTETLCTGSCDIASSTVAGQAACQKACNCCVPYAEGVAFLLPIPCPMQRAYPSFYQTLCNRDPMQRVLRHCQFYCSWPRCLSKGL